MAMPVYRVTIQRLKEAFYQLEPSEQSAYIKKNIELLKQAKGESILQMRCASGAWTIAVMKYPDVDSAMKAAVIWNERNDRYVDTTAYTGYERDAWNELTKSLGL